MSKKIKCPNCKRMVSSLVTEKEWIGENNACPFCEKKSVSHINLDVLYDEYNRKYFNNELPSRESVKLEWSSRFRVAAGYCMETRSAVKRPSYIIRLSILYHNHFREEIKDTLLHEMVHVKEPNHGKGFKREKKRLESFGITLLEYIQPLPDRKYKWKYICKGCGSDVFRFKPMDTFRYVCGHCGSQFNEVKL